MHDGTLVAVKLRDRKTVSFLSTVHNMDMVDTGKRGYDGEHILKFSIVNNYKFMGAVDTSDQMCQYSSFSKGQTSGGSAFFSIWSTWPL